jgi:hypothetical protein
MNIMSKLLAGFLALFLSFSAMAERPAPRVSNNKAYFALGVSSVRGTVSVTGTVSGSGDVSPFNVYGRLGYNFTRYIGIGFEGGGTLLEDDIQGFDASGNPASIDFGISTLFGFLKLMAPIGDKTRIYAMVGPANVKLKASTGGGSISGDDDDTAYGIGFERDLDGYGFTVEYIQYYNEDIMVNGTNIDFKVEGLSIGLIGYF